MSQYELVVLSEGVEKQRIPVDGAGVIIGRSADADIVIDSQTVSRRHAKAWVQGDLLSVEDLGSRNGIGVNGERVRSASFKAGDRFSVGNAVFVVADKSVQAPGQGPNGSAKTPVKGDLRQAAPQGRPSLTTMAAWFRGTARLDDLMQRILTGSLDLVDGQRSFIFHRHPETGEPKLRAFYSRYDSPDGGILDRFIVEKVLPHDNGNGKKKTPVPQAKWHHEDGTLCVPLTGELGCQGVLYVDTPKSGTQFGKTELTTLSTFARMAGAALERLNQKT